MTARIPPEKRTKILNMIEPVLAPACTEVSAKHAESLNGLLNWAGELLVAGRFHLTHTIAAFRTSKARGKAKARVTRAHRDELEFWKDVITNWNCVSVLTPPVFMAPEYSYETSSTTDACRSPAFAGAGCWFNGLYDYWEFSKAERDMFDIMCLEGLAWVLWVEAVLLKDPHAISGRTWRTRCDNQSWVAICMSGKCARSPAAAVLLMHLHKLQCKFHFRILVEWIDTKANIVSDLLSRFAIAEFLRQAALIGFPAPVRMQVKDRSSLVSQMMFAHSPDRRSRSQP